MSQAVKSSGLQSFYTMDPSSCWHQKVLCLQRNFLGYVCQIKSLPYLSVILLGVASTYFLDKGNNHWLFTIRYRNQVTSRISSITNNIVMLHRPTASQTLRLALYSPSTVTKLPTNILFCDSVFLFVMHCYCIQSYLE